MSAKQQLATLRDKIDVLDKQLLRLISERASLAKQIAEIKYHAGDNRDFYRPEREAQILRAAMDENQGPLSDKEVARLLREIMSACLALEHTLKIAYLGPEGTFTHAAALKHFGHSVETMPFLTIDQVFREVESDTCHYGVVPIENSTEGFINLTLDMLINSNLLICGEVELRVHHCLMGKGRDTKQVKHIYSHQQSLAQCRTWLDTHLRVPDRIVVSSNAEAARLAAETPHSLAIAGDSAAEIYALNILERNIEDQPNNTTRFLVLGHRLNPNSHSDKTSLLFSAPNKSGALLHMLSCFSHNNINMTRIESRPSRRRMWDYIFFVDIDGHAEDPAVKKSIDEIEASTAMFKVLGSYPRAIL